MKKKAYFAVAICFLIVTVWPPSRFNAILWVLVGIGLLSLQKEMREPERQKWIHSGKERRKENDINTECRERIHDKISFVVVVCLFLFKFHRLLR